MKTVCVILFFVISLILGNCAFSGIPAEVKDDSLSFIRDIINQVNSKSALTDNVSEEGEITVKNNTGSLTARATWGDKIWFLIEGPFGKDIAEANFNRDKYGFVDVMNDVYYYGKTTEISIQARLRIKCRFDDLLNAVIGTVSIKYNPRDTLSYEDDGNYYIITIKGRDPILGKSRVIKYNVEKGSYFVPKYSLFDDNMQMETKVEFFDLVTNGSGKYAKKVEITKINWSSMKRETAKFVFSEKKINQFGLGYSVNVPSGVRRVETK